MKSFMSMFYKSNKFLILLLFIVLGSAANIFAQRAEKIEKLKMDFIAEKLNLSTQTANDFWPVYNEYDNAKQILFSKFRAQKQNEKDDLQAVEHRMEREKEFLELREKYINRFSKILTPVQLSDLHRAERDFKNLVLRKIKR